MTGLSGLAANCVPGKSGKLSVLVKSQRVPIFVHALDMTASSLISDVTWFTFQRRYIYMRHDKTLPMTIKYVGSFKSLVKVCLFFAFLEIF